jgi:TetR/AcrR family transcriptional repressor of nem operon
MAPARKKLLDTALTVIREKGYGAATVDELCQRAGTAKGSFFHHFADKQALGVAAVAYWSETTGAFFEDAPYHRHKDPLDRIMGYIEFRRALLAGDAATFSCVAGTMVQETYRTHPALRAACGASIAGHARTLEADIEAAMKARGIRGDWTAKGLALHMQAVLQGAFVVAKATDGAQIAVCSVDHLRRYIELLFAKRRRKA